MIGWFMTYWYVIFGITGFVVFVAVRIHRSPDRGALSRRFFYALFPILNPDSPERQRLLFPLAWIVLIVLVLILIFFFLGPE
jgi:hypothetical protein